MSWTKRELIYQAFETIGMAYYAFDLSPEELQSALRQLESMLMTWNLKGLRLGYNAESEPDLDTDSNLPDMAIEATYANLAIRIGPGFGRSISPELKAWGYYAYQALLAQSTKPPYEMQFPETLPRGQGNKPWREVSDNYTSKPADPLAAGNDDIIEFE